MKTPQIKTEEVGLKGILKISLPIFSDERGFFLERFHSAKFKAAGLHSEFVQDNHSRSDPKVLRGLHYQPGQGKLISVISGKIFDIAVNIDPKSPECGRWFGLEMTADSTLLWIPPGFAHGFCVVGGEPAEVFYKITTAYDPEKEKGIRWDDPDLGIKWPISQPTLSPKDLTLPFFKNSL